MSLSGRARIARVVLVGPELRRVDEDAGHDPVGVAARQLHQIMVARVQVAHRRHEADAAAFAAPLPAAGRAVRPGWCGSALPSVSVFGAGEFAGTHRLGRRPGRRPAPTRRAARKSFTKRGPAVAAVHAQQVVQHEDLAIAGRARRRCRWSEYRSRRVISLGQGRRHALQHQQVRAGVGDRACIVEQLLRGGGFAALHAVAAQAKHRLRRQAQVAADRNLALGQEADDVQLVARALPASPSPRPPAGSAWRHPAPVRGWRRPGTAGRPRGRHGTARARRSPRGRRCRPRSPAACCRGPGRPCPGNRPPAPGRCPTSSTLRAKPAS